MTSPDAENDVSDQNALDQYVLAMEASVRKANREMQEIALRRRVTTEMVAPDLQKIRKPVSTALAQTVQPLDDVFTAHDAPDLAGYTSDTHKPVFVGPRLTVPGRRVHYRPFLIAEDESAGKFST